MAQLDLSPKTFEAAWQFCEIVTNSGLCPKGFQGKAHDAFVAIQWGAEIGLKPLQALQNIAVINGRPSLWGDAVIALVRSSPQCEYIKETDDGHTATCIVKRKGEPEETRTFSMDDAKTAGLLGKQGPWTQYPKRMRQIRARAFAVRDVFSDVLKGIAVADEVADYDERDITPKPPKRSLTQERFEAAISAIKSGSYTVEQLKAYDLSDDQQLVLESFIGGAQIAVQITHESPDEAKQ